MILAMPLDVLPAPAAAAAVAATQSLATLPCGVRARVVGLHLADSTGERLAEMGLVPRTVVEVLRRGLGGDPIQLGVRGTLLSLRRAQAQHVEVVPLP